MKAALVALSLTFIACGVDENGPNGTAPAKQEVSQDSALGLDNVNGIPAPTGSEGRVPNDTDPVATEHEYALELSCPPPLVRYNGACHIPGFFAPEPEPEVELPYDPLSPEVLVPALQAIAEAQQDREAMQRDIDANIGSADPGFWDHYLDLMLTLDNAHRALDAAGQVPGVGEIADAFNAALYAAEQDWGNAGVSAVATIPFFGSLGTGSRAVGRTADDLVDAMRSLDDLPGTSSLTSGRIELGERLGSGGSSNVFINDADKSGGSVVKIPWDQPVDPYSSAINRVEHFSEAERHGIPVSREVPTFDRDGNLFFIQEKLADVNSDDPAFEAARDAARKIVEDTNIHFDIENPNNWGVNKDGKIVLRDP